MRVPSKADKKSKLVPGIQVCGLQAVLRCTNIFQCVLLNVDAKKSHGRSCRARACSRRCFVRIRDAAPGMAILTCPLQTLMQSLATVESNNPLVFYYLGCDYAMLCNNDRMSWSAHQPLRIGTAVALCKILACETRPSLMSTRDSLCRPNCFDDGRRGEMSHSAWSSGSFDLRCSSHSACSSLLLAALLT